ncbi:MAG: DUF349 domain-containing protein [Muribaculaceae bacterium]|nr:DUF349 domain-containing protein [Muribaculaceae bacterium]
MESREQMSGPVNEIEKDVTLNSEPAIEAGEAEVRNEQNNEQAIVAQPVDEVQPMVAAQPADELALDDDAQPADEALPTGYAIMDKAQLVERLEQVVQQPVETIRGEVAAIKAAFYALRKQELAAERDDFLARGNEESAFAPRDDEHESRVKELLELVKQKRAEYNAAQEAIKAENLHKKRDIIRQIEEITSDPDNINRQFPKVQQLQQDFKAVGQVPAPDETEVWKAYQLAVEKFYDLLKINKELRDYDFKKNLEIKQALCADAEALDDENDVVNAFKRLQELHNTWRETGPVAKELREELWARFKTASAVINKKYQAFFEERKQREKEAADAKLQLCEEIEAIDIDKINTYSEWDEKTKVVIGLQERWKQLGFASRKVNTQLYLRFRTSCDKFFARKAEFYKKNKEMFAANLEQKIKLCEQAEALKDSTEWRKTTDALVALQRQWKTIGPVAKRHSDEVWKRFIAACDHFFEQKKQQFQDVHAVERDNLKAKREVIAAIRQATESGDSQAAAQTVRELMTRWSTIGHVPYRDKDKVYAEYREAVDQAFDKLDMKGTRATLASYQSTISQYSGTDKMSHEREKLVRDYEKKCSELKTFENNMGFFNAQSKSGNSLVKEMERRIGRIKDEIALLEQKIKLIDEREA